MLHLSEVLLLAITLEKGVGTEIVEVDVKTGNRGCLLATTFNIEWPEELDLLDLWWFATLCFNSTARCVLSLAIIAVDLIWEMMREAAGDGGSCVLLLLMLLERLEEQFPSHAVVFGWSSGLGETLSTRTLRNFDAKKAVSSICSLSVMVRMVSVAL